MANHTTGAEVPRAAPSPPTAPLIDIGINLAHDSFDADRDAVLARARAAGVVQMIVTGSSEASTAAAVALARAHPQRLFATAGVHPHHADQWSADVARLMRDWAERPEVVAVGECGLDYYRNLSAPAAQRAAFQRQLELAVGVGKPVFLHQRDAHQDFVAILREHREQLRGAVAHCFTGTAAELECYLQMQLFIGITGWICDERRGAHLLPLLRAIPRDQLLLETDAPYLLPRDLEPPPVSRRNESAYLPHIAAAVARARGEDFVDTAAATTANARRFFSLPMIDVN
jgi:TatD DNase family protein